MFYVYILQSQKTNRFYIGSTENLSKRVLAHNSGSNRSTKNGRPWVLVLSEEVSTRAGAIKREAQIKSYKGGEAFKRLVGLI